MDQSPSSNQTGHHFTSLGLELTYIRYCRLQLGHQSRQHGCTVSATPHTTVAKLLLQLTMQQTSAVNIAVCGNNTGYRAIMPS